MVVRSWNSLTGAILGWFVYDKIKDIVDQIIYISANLDRYLEERKGIVR
jgi:hypothetical protein